jgi:hypothetical protein
MLSDADLEEIRNAGSLYVEYARDFRENVERVGD